MHAEPEAGTNTILQCNDDILDITTTDPVHSGRANKAIVKAVANYLSVSSQTRIGFRYHCKITN
jgi:uncharacterized protein YggU (UPF0235/DUF167 family)